MKERPIDSDKIKDVEIIYYKRKSLTMASWRCAEVYMVEFWCNDMAHPVGTAWVTLVYHSAMNSPRSAYVDWIYVMEGWRHLGVASALKDSMERRWGDQLIYEPINGAEG